LRQGTGSRERGAPAAPSGTDWSNSEAPRGIMRAATLMEGSAHAEVEGVV
jgi:hypothetical protein